MHVAYIAPTDYLSNIISYSKYHLVLADIYLKNIEYASFYKWRRACGDILLLDNGAYEFGTSIATEKLIDVFKDLQPRAVFLPDIRFNSEGTLKHSKAAFEKMKFLGCLKFGIPQGNSLESVIDCYTKLVELGVDGFGIYEEIGEVTGLGSRYDFLSYLKQQNLIIKDKKYHLLGMEEDLSILKNYNDFPEVLGIDSAKPIVFGIQNVPVEVSHQSQYMHRPKEYFKFKFADLSVEQSTCVLKNMSFCNKILNIAGGNQNEKMRNFIEWWN